VRTFGALVGHVAGTQNMLCAIVLGDKPAAEDAIEKGPQTKTVLVAALTASTTYCEKAYAIAGAAATAAVDMFGEKGTKVGALALNAVHDGEHYGNIITYMRMQGKVPPSSKRQRDASRGATSRLEALKVLATTTGIARILEVGSARKARAILMRPSTALRQHLGTNRAGATPVSAILGNPRQLLGIELLIERR